MRSRVATTSLLLAASTLAVTLPAQRPPASRLLSEAELSPPPLANCVGGGGMRECSEQVHLALGGPGEMVVSYATADDETQSQVVFWGAEDAPPRVANGTTNAYSQLIYLVDGAIEPAIGDAVDEQKLLGMQNTSWWAADLPLFPYGRSSSYHNKGTLDFRLAKYKNPGMIYNSPVIHTVTLGPLHAGHTYGYRVAGSSRNFSFTMPPDGPAILAHGATATGTVPEMTFSLAGAPTG